MEVRKFGQASVTSTEFIVDRQVAKPMKKLVLPLRFTYLKEEQAREVPFVPASRQGVAREGGAPSGLILEQA